MSTSPKILKDIITKDSRTLSLSLLPANNKINLHKALTQNVLPICHNVAQIFYLTKCKILLVHLMNPNFHPNRP